MQFIEHVEKFLLELSKYHWHVYVNTKVLSHFSKPNRKLIINQELFHLIINYK